jgi:hypothetical protein
MRIGSNGNVCIGATPNANDSFRVAKNITGGTASYSIDSTGIVQSDVTNTAGIFLSYPGQAAGFTLTDLKHFIASQGTISGTVTNQYGFVVESSATGATNNFGFYGNIASGANRYNLYMAGTAANFLAGALTLGTSGTNANLTINGNTTLLHQTTPSSPAANNIKLYPKSDNKLYVLDSNGVEIQVGSGAAGGFINYVENPDAESSTTGWSTYADAAASLQLMERAELLT